MSPKDRSAKHVPRRQFLQAGGAVAVAAVAGSCSHAPARTEPVPARPRPADPEPAEEQPAPVVAKREEQPSRIRSFRTLGRTGFKVSDIAMGCGRISDANVVRYAYDRGVNLFDTAEGYGDGDSERKIGQAMRHMDRDKIFIVTKLKISRGESERSILERYAKCLERLKTSYVDALYMHSVSDVALIKHRGFHAATRRLKADGKLRHAGISSHGPRHKGGDGMDTVLLAAVEDGRFDVMLLIHGFMNPGPGQRVLAACKDKNVGTTLMKVAPGMLKYEPFDADNPSEEHAKLLDHIIKRGTSRKEAIAWLRQRLERQRKEIDKHRPQLDAFASRHGVTTTSQLKQRSVQWALQNDAVNTVCVSMSDFETVDAFLPLSGKKLSRAQREELDAFARWFDAQHCRVGCTECLDRCPHDLPVSTVLRYVYYFRDQRREKYAMQRYAALSGRDGARCLACDAPCLAGCPHAVDIQCQLMLAHDLLTLG